MKKRNGTISFLKFIFAILIMIMHFDRSLRNGYVGGPPIRPAYLCVEFFFIVSGYYFGKAIMDELNKKSNIYLDNLKMIWKKIKKLLPYSIIATAIGSIFLLIFHKIKPSQLALSVYGAFLVNMTGIGDFNIMLPLWYLSSMLIVMFVIYPVIRKQKENYAFYTAPLIILFGLGYMYRCYHMLDITYSSWNGLFYGGLLRALVEISIGVVIAFSMQHIISLFERVKFKHLSKLLTIIELLLYSFIIAFMIFYSKKSAIDYFILIIMVIAVTISLSGKSLSTKWLSHKFIFYLEKLSLLVYINHYAFSILFESLGKLYNFHFFLSLSLAIMCTFIFSIVEMIVADHIKRRRTTSS